MEQSALEKRFAEIRRFLRGIEERVNLLEGKKPRSKKSARKVKEAKNTLWT